MALSFAGICYENMIAFICIGVMPILNVVIFIGITPLFTILFAVPILGERFDCWNVVQALISFIGVVMIAFGDFGDHNETSLSATIPLPYWIGLFMTPFMISFGDL